MRSRKQPDGESTGAGARSTAGGIPYVVAAGLLAIVVTVAVLAFGIERPPPLESLQDRPAPSPESGVAWLSWSGSSQCVHVAADDGRVTRPWCGEAGGELAGWDGSSVLLALYEGSGVLSIDVETGRVSRRASDDDVSGGDPFGQRPFGEPRGVLTSYRDGGELVVEDGDRELWRVTASPGYRVDRGWESPDGRWIAAADSADRLLLFATAGEVAPRVWVPDADGVATLVWEGEVPEGIG